VPRGTDVCVWDLPGIAPTKDQRLVLYSWMHAHLCKRICAPGFPSARCLLLIPMCWPQQRMHSHCREEIDRCMQKGRLSLLTAFRIADLAAAISCSPPSQLAEKLIRNIGRPSDPGPVLHILRAPDPEARREPTPATPATPAKAFAPDARRVAAKRGAQRRRCTAIVSKAKQPARSAGLSSDASPAGSLLRIRPGRWGGDGGGDERSN
jgi:hypothetical protein